jgi:hypothetical protein
MERRSLALLGLYALVAGAVGCSSSKPATPVAPTNIGATSAPDGSTLKVTPAALRSPVNDQKLLTPEVNLTASPATGEFASNIALQYRFEVRTSSNALVQEVVVGSPTWQVTATLLPNTRYMWRVRPEFQGEAGPWSGLGSFITLDPLIIDDPLTDGRTVGNQIGGRFLPGQGWQSLSQTNGIDYDLREPCRDCRLEFDATNFGPKEGYTIARDIKWVSMGEASTFSSFGAFRDHPWKMHLIQRADHDTGMEIIWRNGDNGEHGDPGDHRIKLLSTPITFASSRSYHFQLDWNKEGFQIAVNGIEVMSEGWDYWYEPTNHRISLGCYPRGESFTGIIYSNVKLKKH